MPKVKIKRKSTLIDMTAMCDVASLLLTFFILTATARQPEPLPVDIPSSTAAVKVPDTDISVLTIGGGGKVFFGVVGQDIRVRMLERIGDKYNIKFTDEEKLRFSLIESFGVPVGNLKEFIALSGNERNNLNQPGIPRDSSNNELNQWILHARYATKELHNQDLRFSIKGDANEEYPVIRDVIDILQGQDINKFSLITSLEGL